ncbi:uncharacterized protein APUU_11087S [Aspergillus puulaauensis]|uniref:Uncharacterized protein n=1 Tax=Aspergillus puulaauensis TaxID=1220207 RepID=A0A7R7XBI5_9EURO|nr:uncharacterized protein APUU_11087S [Aspergillus puulaauensis]BCS18259.1 hypothetical protein APUU_11087S [Aspergillus puulaauensis]
MRYLPLVHVCLLTFAARLVAAAVIPAPADTPVLPSSGTVNDDDAANNADCIPGKTCDIFNPNPPKAPAGGSLETVPMITTTDAFGNTITAAAGTNNPVPPRPTADETNLSITMINGNTPVIADPIPPAPPSSLTVGNAVASPDCDDQAIPDPAPGVPAADQVYTTTDVRGNVFTVPAWLPQPSEHHQADALATKYSRIPVISDPVPAQPTTDAAGNPIGTPSNDTPFVDPPPEGLPTMDSGVVNDPVTPHKIYGDGHIMTPIMPVDMATTTRPHYTRPTQIVNSEGQTVQIDARPPRPASVDTSGLDPTFVDPIPRAVPSDIQVFVDPVPPAPPNGNVPVYVDPIPPAIPTNVKFFVDPIPPAAPSDIQVFVDPVPPAPPNGNVPVYVDPIPPAPPNADADPTKLLGPRQATDNEAAQVNQVNQVKRQNQTSPSSATPTSTRREPCGANICGGNDCARGSATWATVAPINCLRIPTNTARAQPTGPTRKDYLVQHSKESSSNSPSSPLMDYPKQSKQVDDYLLAMLVKFNARRTWYVNAKNDISGKWYGFEDYKTAAGLSRLYGCTAVFIVSKQGVYVSHIYESPIFVREPAPGQFVPTSDSYFRKATFETLVHGQKNTQSDFLEPIERLVGKKEKPGPLHFTNQPKIFIVTPFQNLDDASGPIMYPEKVEWLSNTLYGYLYPSGSAEYSQEPVTLPYKIPTVVMSEDIKNTDGKAKMEASKLIRYDRVGDKLIPVGRWRLWVNRIELATWEFSGTIEKPIGEQAKNSNDPAYAGICPVSESTPTTTASSSSTSSAQVSSLSDLPLPLPFNQSQIQSKGCIMSKSSQEPPKFDVDLIEQLAYTITRLPANAKLIDFGKYNHTIPWDAGKPLDNNNNKPWYEAEIKLADDCTGGPQNAHWPMELYSADDIIRDIFFDIFFRTLDEWKRCGDNIVGRKMQYGCLVYSAWCNGCSDY